ncbi:hypothetical protein [Alkalicoccobacillus porphyridii]|uniref:YhfM-like domain-containing protein n=1 Tax=Alkalicoccobacillus porphyridii TaxID=2597270 RepID=A0A553ZV91_9BACI|nr:hypothetical protein [Alkalicoccobacillus porphyridii]TSB45342.1 hypothetical protein FN960_16720 [Alkalicoccobacillus porphyridii]
MKKRHWMMLVVVVFSATWLVGCQTHAKESQNDLIREDVEITSITFNENGQNGTVHIDESDFEDVTTIISSAKQESGIVNMTEPELHLKVHYTDDENQLYFLWIAEEEEDSVLMSSEDTHVIYTISGSLNEELKELLE